MDFEWQLSAIASLVAWAGLGVALRQIVIRLDARRHAESEDNR